MTVTRPMTETDPATIRGTSESADDDSSAVLFVISGVVLYPQSVQFRRYDKHLLPEYCPKLFIIMCIKLKRQNYTW
jgi:hypothetical protein